MSINNSTFLKQAEIIDELRIENQHLRRLLEPLKAKARYYEILTNLVRDHTILESDWERFCFLIRMCCDEEDMKNLQ